MNFATMLEDLRAKTGKCSLPLESYATITGYRKNCFTGKVNEVKLHWLIIDDLYFQILNGVTGYEIWYLKNLIKSVCRTEHTWIACAGTKNKYDELYVNTKEFFQIVDNFKLGAN